MKYEASNPEGMVALLCANLQTTALSAFSQYEQQIEALTKALKEAQEKIKKLEPEKEPKEINKDKPKTKAQ